MSSSVLLKSSIGKKVFMALTGLFLCIFLMGHLAGNLQLILITGEEGQLAFNSYAKFMTTNPLVKILSYLTYFSILFHAVDGILLTIQNRAARPVNYTYNKPGVNSSWMSRFMAPMGVIILIFIVLHMSGFWAGYHWGEMGVDSAGNKDLHTEVMKAFQVPWITAFYIFSMIVIAFHLLHGFQSSFQSLGLNHPTYTPIFYKVGVAFAIIVPVLFAIIPIIIFLRY